MANPETISETQVSDGKGGKVLVKTGSRVDLSVKADNRAFLREWLGEGPYTISWIGRWPCGRAELYFAMAGGDHGAHASDFMAVD